MPQTLLGSLALAYQPLWGKSRELCGIRLAVSPVPDGFVDAPHLLQVLRNFWPHRNASLIISPESPDLLCTLLEQAPAYSPCIEVGNEALEDPAIAQRVRTAHARGLQMIWRGPNNWDPAPDLAPCFRQYLLSMDPQDTVDALHAMRSREGYASFDEGPGPSPVRPGQIYEDLPSRALVDHSLDQRRVAAILGWPSDEVLQVYRYASLQPSARSLRLVVNAVCADASLETIEHLIGEDAVLAYRLLTHVNSAAMGLRSGIDTLRRALMMMGYTALKDWCIQQSPHANDDVDVHPVRNATVMRAHLAGYLLDAGGEYDMRGEIHLCGLFSQLDLLLGDPLPEALGRLPLSDRIVEAVCAGEGPYAPYLAIAKAMESTRAGHLVELCQGFEMSLDDVNRALLRTLGITSVRTGG